jgi:hypothetical protein
MQNLHAKFPFICAIFLLLLTCRTPAQDDLQPPAVDVTGTWSILSTSETGEEGLKTVTFTQEGTQLRGTFKGSRQESGLSGFISGKHIRFITLTPTQLKFRGKVDGNTMSGTFGVRGKTSEWTATRLGVPPDAGQPKQQTHK